MIHTTYKCDLCGHTQEKYPNQPKHIYQVEIIIRKLDPTQFINERYKCGQVCEECAEKL